MSYSIIQSSISLPPLPPSCMLLSYSFPIHLLSLFISFPYSSPFPIHLLPSSFTIHLIYHSNGRYSSTAVMMAATAGDPANAARTVQLLLTVVGDAILHFQVCCLFIRMNVIVCYITVLHTSRYVPFYTHKRMNVIVCSCTK